MIFFWLFFIDVSGGMYDGKVAIEFFYDWLTVGYFWTILYFFTPFFLSVLFLSTVFTLNELGGSMDILAVNEPILSRGEMRLCAEF